MSKIRGKTIAIRTVTGGPARKITKIIGYGAKGFAVVTPYHAARAGFVGKMPVDYKKIGQFEVPHTDIVGFTTSDRVKLSYHPDGFVQFSGEAQGAIISGRDPTNGLPKGVALMSQPLSSPVRSGPTFGITAWGLHDFSALPDTDAVSPATVLFEPDDLYFRGATPCEANGIILEVFAFPKRYWAGVRKRGRDYVLTIAFKDFEASRAAIELKVIDIPGQDVMLAGFASNARLTFPSDSGWVLSGPGSAAPDGKGHVLVAFYPRDTFDAKGLPSLDR
ncbi:MAG: hypothetical protein ACYCTF_05610 [Acidiferrobacter sp.]